MHGLGPNVKPGIGSGDGIRLASSILVGMVMRNRCIMDTKNKKVALLATDSPRQIRFPRKQILHLKKNSNMIPKIK